MPGSTAWVTRKRPRRLTAIVASQSSRVSSWNGRAMRTPALLTRTSISPSSDTTCRYRAAHLLGIGHIRREHQPPPRRRPGAPSAAGLDLRRRAGADADPVAGPAEGESGRAADALGGTGDERGDWRLHGRKINAVTFPGMTLPLQHPVVRPTGLGPRTPERAARRAGANGCGRCGTCLGCSGWSGKPSRATWSAFSSSGSCARSCRSACSGSASSSWTRWSSRWAWRPAAPRSRGLRIAELLGHRAGHRPGR